MLWRWPLPLLQREEGALSFPSCPGARAGASHTAALQGVRASRISHCNFEAKDRGRGLVALIICPCPDVDRAPAPFSDQAVGPLGTQGGRALLLLSPQAGLQGQVWPWKSAESGGSPGTRQSQGLALQCGSFSGSISFPRETH